MKSPYRVEWGKKAGFDCKIVWRMQDFRGNLSNQLNATNNELLKRLSRKCYYILSFLLG